MPFRENRGLPLVPVALLLFLSLVERKGKKKKHPQSQTELKKYFYTHE